MAKEIFTHFGNNIYHPELVSIVRNVPANKPNHGLWGSPKMSGYSYYDLCVFLRGDTNAVSLQFDFELLDDSKIFRPHDHSEDVTQISFDRLYDEYDGIDIRKSRPSDLDYFITLDWGCDGICVWNKDIIKIL